MIELDAPRGQRPADRRVKRKDDGPAPRAGRLSADALRDCRRGLCGLNPGRGHGRAGRARDDHTLSRPVLSGSGRLRRL